MKYQKNITCKIIAKWCYFANLDLTCKAHSPNCKDLYIYSKFDVCSIRVFIISYCELYTVYYDLATFICYVNRNIYCLTIIELVAEFASGQFAGLESSGFIEVIVRITGGSSSTPIIVTVTPSVQSPVSAMGRQWLLTVNISTTNYCTVIGSGVDFNSNPLTITINAGATDGRANISVTCDNVTEGLETFGMRLTLTSSSSGVTLGRDTCEGQIIGT